MKTIRSLIERLYHDILFRGCRRAEHVRVAASTAIQRIVTGRSVKNIVAVCAVQNIVQRVAGQDVIVRAANDGLECDR